MATDPALASKKAREPESRDKVTKPKILLAWQSMPWTASTGQPSKPVCRHEKEDKMPTYTVSSANVELSVEQEAELSAAITEAHHKSTGAPGFFAQTIFSPIAASRHYIGGKPNKTPHVFVHGLIRAGRSAEVKSALMAEIAKRVCTIARIGSEDIWVYIQDIPADQMIEFGRMLPAPGSEDEWRKGISPEKRRIFAKAGVVF